ncbi:MAG: 4'-phosphopantetheinyl transferase superfamily protein [Casimicrobiaceae bacterium]
MNRSSLPSIGPALEHGVVDVWWGSPVGPASAAPETLLDTHERTRAARFASDADRFRFVAAHVMQRIVLGNYLGVAPERLRFNHGTHGKPALATDQYAPCPAFNLSHSGNTIVLAVGAVEAVGVDVEELRTDVDVPAVGRLVFSAAELAALAATAAAVRHARFFEIWVRKEAVLKAMGAGFSAEPKSVSVGVGSGSPGTGGEGVVPADVPGQETRWGVRDLAAPDGCRAAIAAPGVNWSVRVFHHRWALP